VPHVFSLLKGTLLGLGNELSSHVENINKSDSRGSYLPWYTGSEC